MSPKFPLSKETFMRLGIPKLLINVWEYNDPENKNCQICIQYEKWCIEALQSMWQPEFYSFDFVIKQIHAQNETFCNLGKYSSQDRHLIYNKLYKT